MTGMSREPLHHRSPFADVLISLFHVLTLSERKTTEASPEQQRETEPSAEGTQNESQRVYGPGLPVEVLQELVKQDIAQSKREGFYTGTGEDRAATPAYPSTVSAAASRARSGVLDVVATVLLSPVWVPIGAAAMLTVFGSPFFMGVASADLWRAAYSRFGSSPEELAVALIIVLGASLLAGFIVGRVWRILGRRGFFWGTIGVLLPLGVCVPILVNAWWYPLPNLADQALVLGRQLYGTLEYTRPLYYVNPLSTAALSLVGAGWGFFVGMLGH